MFDDSIVVDVVLTEDDLFECLCCHTLTGLHNVPVLMRLTPSTPFGALCLKCSYEIIKLAATQALKQEREART